MWTTSCASTHMAKQDFLPTPEELEAESTVSCRYCKAKAGDGCRTLPSGTYLKGYRHRFGPKGSYIHGERLKAFRHGKNGVSNGTQVQG